MSRRSAGCMYIFRRQGGMSVCQFPDTLSSRGSQTSCKLCSISGIQDALEIRGCSLYLGRRDPWVQGKTSLPSPQVRSSHSRMTDVYMYRNTNTQNPLKDFNGSDPQMQYWNGQYYLLTTEWTHIAITTSPTLEGLKTAEPKMVHSSDDPSRCCNLWA
jgi:hypothetical protein